MVAEVRRSPSLPSGPDAGKLFLISRRRLARPSCSFRVSGSEDQAMGTPRALAM